MHTYDDICKIQEKLIDWVEEEVAKGKDCINCEELGEAIDMVKDLSKTKKDCWEAEYYRLICEAMTEEEDEEGRMGYDHYRYPSSGRFASKGHGRRYGYVPPMFNKTPDDPFPPYIRTFDPVTDYRLGYGESTGKMGDDRHGRAYRDFKASKKFYTETHAPEHKGYMTEHAKEHMMDVTESVRDIWDSADPDLRKKMKTDLTNLLTELN